jgi:hypothetical protein
MHGGEKLSLEQIRALLEAAEVRFAGHSRVEIYEWIEKTLREHDYAKQGREAKGRRSVSGEQASVKPRGCRNDARGKARKTQSRFLFPFTALGNRYAFPTSPQPRRRSCLHSTKIHAQHHNLRVKMAARSNRSSTGTKGNISFHLGGFTPGPFRLPLLPDCKLQPKIPCAIQVFQNRPATRTAHSYYTLESTKRHPAE